MGHIDVIAMCVQLPANKVKSRPSAATPALTKQPITPLKPRRQAEDDADVHDSDDEEDFVPTRRQAQAANRIISPHEEPSNQVQLMANHGRARHPTSQRLQERALAANESTAQPKNKVNSDC